MFYICFINEYWLSEMKFRDISVTFFEGGGGYAFRNCIPKPQIAERSTKLWHRYKEEEKYKKNI